MYNFFWVLFLIFIIYSIIGYIGEVIYCSYLNKKFVNRGFLYGPYCPIYGLGALLIFNLLFRYHNDPIIIFVFSMIIASILEYFISFVLEKIFHNKWWDYSTKKYNLNGRICLENTLYFGIGAVLVIYFVHPLIMRLLLSLDIKTIFIISLILLIVFLIDCIYSITEAFGLKKRIDIVNSTKNKKKFNIISIETLVKDSFKKIKTTPKRLLKAFPNIRTDDIKVIDVVKNTLNKIEIDRKKEKKKRRKK